MSSEVVVTRLGARAMLDRETGEVMHPVVGPRVEAAQLYVAPARLEARLRAAAPGAGDPLVLLDVGLGAGTNAATAFLVSEALPPSARHLVIVSFDRTLEPLEVALRPEHADAFALDGAAGEAARALIRRGLYETPRTTWRFVGGELPAVLDAEPAARADVVFWDPFSPRANPEMWTLAAFRRLHRACRAGATVHTYSGATATRSALLLAGFAVGSGEADGDPSTVAALDVADLTRPLDRRWLARLERSSAPFPADAPPDALRTVRDRSQFALA